VSGSPTSSSVDAEVTERLDALRKAVDNARAMPMSASVVVNRTDLGYLVDKVDSAVREAVSEANDVLARRAEILAEGESQVREMLRQARLERDRLVGDTEVFHSALREADRLRIEAGEEGQALRDDADAYVAERLATFEGTLDSTLEAVRRGRERLGHTHGNGRRVNGRVNGQQNGQQNGHAHPMAALGDDSDVDRIVLPEHLER
jgi:hypothetical protein